MWANSDLKQLNNRERWQGGGFTLYYYKRKLILGDPRETSQGLRAESRY